jgi:hypothetical protein
MQTLSLTSYQAYIHCSPQATAYLGRRLALIVDSACGQPLLGLCASHPSELAAVLRDLEALLDCFDSVLGKAPPLTSSLEGRSICEVSFLPNAAGLAHHGRAGFAVGPAFLEQSIASRLPAGLASTGAFLSHCFTYEACRNYIFPAEFTAVFDYRCLEGPQATGWVNQGFVDVLGSLLCADSGLGFDYHGHTLPSFHASMEAEVDTFLASGLPWEAVFQHERFPWNAARSLDNLYAGLLIRLWRGHGRLRFLRRWFRGAIPLLRASRCPVGTEDVATARENFFLASCFAAQADLRPFFEQLRWPLRPGAAGAALETALAAAAVYEEGE